MKKIKKLFIVSLLVLLFLPHLNFLVGMTSSSKEVISNKEKNQPSKNYWKAVAECFSLNIGVWAYDWYVKKAEWANISLYSIKKNIKMGYIWDDNSFMANQGDHPFHGAMYWAAARTNGLSFWESVIFPFWGSFFWEVVLETNRPSTNDSISTTLGGIFLGETLFRLANLIIDEQARGIERIGRECFAFLVNPMVGIDRLISGKSWKRQARNGIKHFYDFQVPIRLLGQKDSIGISLTYKNAWAYPSGSWIEPYDYFDFDIRLTLNRKKRPKIERLLSEGLLFGKKDSFSKNCFVLWGIFGNFDYFMMPANRISSIGLGPGLLSELKLNHGWFLNNTLTMSGIFGGSTSSFVLRFGENIFKQYNETHRFGSKEDPYYLGPGFLGKLGLEIGNEKIGSIESNIYCHWVKSIFGTSAKEQVAIVNFLAKVKISRWCYLGIEREYLIRKGFYRHYDPLVNTNKNFSFYLSLNF